MGCCSSTEVVKDEQPVTSATSPFANSDVANVFSRSPSGRGSTNVNMARHETMSRRLKSTDLIKKKLKEITGSAEDKDIPESSDNDSEVSESILLKETHGANTLSESETALVLNYLSRNFLFGDVPHEKLKRLCKALNKVTVGKDQVLLRQGQLFDERDLMYILVEGEVQVSIAAGGSRSQVIKEGPGWIFGHLSLIFRSQRTASISTCTTCRLLTLSRPVLMTLPRPSMLAFLRKIPVLTIMSDNSLTELAESCTSERFSSGQHLIKFGDKSEPVVYFIRHGQVKVMRPSADGKPQVLAMLSRGKVIGQRTVVTGRMRSADCVAEGPVDVIAATASVFSKLDTPLLTGWLDFDAVTTVLKHTNKFHEHSSDSLDDLVEEFVLKKFKAGEVVVPAGVFQGIYIVRAGSLRYEEDCQDVREANGFVYVGDLISATVVKRDIYANTNVSVLCYKSKSHEKQPLDAILRRQVPQVAYSDLEMKRVIGIGNSGRVYLVQHKVTKITYALKAMDKHKIRHAKQVQHTKNELLILKSITHPFCTGFVAAYQDARWLYILQEWVPGGELFTHLQNSQCFAESIAKFYSANVLLALEHIHSKGIVYRDLKPENLLMDASGYIKIADFGFAKKMDLNSRTYTICGTPEYQAPEIVAKTGTTRLVDLWSFGILIYDMLTGFTPFQSNDDDIFKIYRKAASGRFQVPSNISKNAADLIYKLVVVDPDARLGARNTSDIKLHPWFADIDFDKMYARTIPAPNKPALKSTVDTSYFDDYDKEIKQEDKQRQPPGSVISERWLEWDEI